MRNKEINVCLVLIVLFLGLHTIYLVYFNELQTVITNTYTHLESYDMNESHSLYTMLNEYDGHEFDDPDSAYNILVELHFNIDTISQKSPLHQKRLKFYEDDEYCMKSLKQFIYHPDKIFKEMNFWTDFSKDSLIRKIINKIGNDLPPKKYYLRPISKQKPFYFSKDIGLYFSTEYIHESLIMGRQFGCSNQLYNKMLKIKSLANKGEIIQHYQNYLAKYKKKSQSQCIHKIIPESYLLDNVTQCNKFFKYIESKKYQENKDNGTYFLQKSTNSSQENSLKVINEIQETELKKLYANGKLCSSIEPKNILIQQYIQNPLLIEGNKFDIRVHMLIASVDPILVYYYNDSILTVSLEKYDNSSTENIEHLLNTQSSSPDNIFKMAKKNHTWNGKTEKELREYHIWTFDRLYQHLYTANIVKDINWLKDHIEKQIKLSLIHLIRSAQDNFQKRSNIYNLWALDMIIDNDFKIWFVQANNRPSLVSSNPVEQTILQKIINDHYLIMFAHLRSRMKRVIQYVNKLSRDLSEQPFLYEEGKMSLVRVKRKEFSEINRNFMDPEFESSLNTTSFLKIIDENFDGPKRYSNLLPNECI